MAPSLAALAAAEAEYARALADYATWLRGPFAERLSDVIALTAASELRRDGLAISIPSTQTEA